MTFETNTYSYFIDSNQSHCDMEYNLPDFHSYAFGSPTYSTSSSAMGSSPDRPTSHDEPIKLKRDQFTERPLLTPPSRSRFQKAKTSLFESPENPLHPYCYSLPPLTCYSPNTRSQKCHQSKSLQKVLTGAPRRYQCTVCVKRFTRPSSLATHMHSHTGEVKF
jgi:hypothetical protein